jgi:serine/threonine-protein kinase
MANLFLGRSTGPDGFEKLVAIKRIHEHLSSNPEFVKMFKDEARLAAKISHPNVAQVMELGLASGCHFMAMEYVAGESLSALVRRCQVPLTVCAKIVANAASGLHAAHELKDQDGNQLGVVHRDVSPQNILVSYEGAVKVVDFGVARARDNLHVTTAGTVKGKFSYMAPEQAKTEHVDRRADTFALGIVLYEITTRHRLFKGGTDFVTVNKVLNSQIVPPSRLVPGYPATLERIVLKALQRPLEARYQSALDLQESLERFIIESGEPVTQATIARFMGQVFADRIQAKAAMLKDCGNAIDEVPAVELSGTNPTLTMSGRVASRADAELEDEERRLRRRRRVKGALIAMCAGLAALAAGAGAFFLLAEREPTVAAEEGARRAPNSDRGTPSQRATSLVQADAAIHKTKPRAVRIRIEAQPSEATITLAGKLVSNPYLAEESPRAGKAGVSIQAPGFVSRQFEVDTAEGGSWVIALARRDPLPVAGSKASEDQATSGRRKRTGVGTRSKRVVKRREAVGEKPVPDSKKVVRKKKQDDELFGNPYGQ